MRGKLLLGAGGGALAAAMGCASLLDIPDREVDWCNRSENQHDVCEDFDHDDAGGDWQQGVLVGTKLGFDAAGFTAPNAADLTVDPQPLGSGTVIGIYQQYM